MPKRFLTTVPRYVEGKFIHASIEYPVEVVFPDDRQISQLDLDTKALIPIHDGEAPPEPPKLKPPFAQVRRGPPNAQAATSKRPSDSEPQ